MKVRDFVGGVCLMALAVASGIPARSAEAQGVPPGASLTSRAGTIAGTVWDGNDKPIPAARLRLRDLTSGRITMTTRGDQEGRFRFPGVRPGSYLVELVDEAGNVRAVGQTFAIGPSETIATFLRVGARAPWYTGFFSNAAVAAVSSAAGLGLTAVGNGMQPASGRF